MASSAGTYKRRPRLAMTGGGVACLRALGTTARAGGRRCDLYRRRDRGRSALRFGSIPRYVHAAADELRPWWEMCQCGKGSHLLQEPGGGAGTAFGPAPELGGAPSRGPPVI